MRAFAAHGVELASLRQIAKAAGCSLTLLVHHFGDKAGLVRAVANQQQQSSERRLDTLRAQLAPEPLTFERLARAWAHYEFDQQSTREGRLYLNVMLRLRADPKVDDDVRLIVNSAEALVTRGLERVRPSLDEASLKGLWLLASGGLYALVTNLAQIQETATAEVMASMRERAVIYLVRGLYGYCEPFEA